MLICIIVKTCTIEKIVSERDSNETSPIKFLKELFSSDLSGNLAYIMSNFVVISKKCCLSGERVEMNDRFTGSRREL